MARAAIAFLILLIGGMCLIGGMPFIQKAAGEDPIGTAGSFRLWGWIDCGAAQPGTKADGCDPAPVDRGLAGHALAAAHVDRAMRLLSIGQLAQVRDELTAALAAEPANLDALRLRARISITLEDRVSAAADLQRARMIAPDDPDVLVNLALLDPNWSDKAMSLLDQSLRAKPGNADARWVRAQILQYRGDLKGALGELDQGLKIEPGEMRLTLMRAALGVRLGGYKQVIDDSTQVLTIVNSASAYRYRAIARANLGDPSGALDDLTRSLNTPGEVGPFVAQQVNQTRMLRTMLLVRLGREEEARQNLDDMARTGDPHMILQLRLLLRRHGIDVPITSQWSPDLEKALRACFLDDACGIATWGHA